VTAAVRDTAQLKWWLRAFGDMVSVAALLYCRGSKGLSRGTTRIQSAQWRSGF
jgi:hypothetical protein